MKVCVECGEPIVPQSPAHSAHEPGCPVEPDSEDWHCGCDAYAHIRCCRACRPVEVASTVEPPRRFPGVSLNPTGRLTG